MARKWLTQSHSPSHIWVFLWEGTLAKFPALPLFTDSYMADTRHLSAAQHGAYLLLLMTAWRMPDCTLPDDDDFLSKCASMDKRTWNNNRSTVIAFFQKDGQGRLYQPRLKDERNYVEYKRNKNSASGRASALKNKERHSTNVQQNFNENSTPTPTPTSFTKVKDADALFWESCRDYLGANKSSLIGKWVKDYGKGAVFEAVSQAQKNNPADPVTYIAGILRGKQQPLPKGEKPKMNVKTLTKADLHV